MKRIAHLDLDCFFVSCERIKNPSLIGKPVIVGGSSAHRGVVCSASYEARKFGVRSAMPAGQARRLCPQGIFVPTDHSFYSKMSRRVREFLEEVAPVVEQASIDEFYLDLSGCERIYPDWKKFGISVKEYLKNEMLLPCSIAITPSKLVSKIAVGEVKPDGFVVIEEGNEEKFLAPLSIQVMPGIGKATEREMSRLGLKTLGDIAAQDQTFLVTHFGKWGHELKSLVMGIDHRKVVAYEDPKSISRETTFEKDEGDLEYLISVLSGFAEECAHELRSYDFTAKHISIKLRLPDFTTFDRSRTFFPTNQEKDIFEAGETILRENWKKGMKLRLIGLGVSGFSKSAHARLLFSDENRERDKKISLRLDQIRAKYGFEIIQRGSSLIPSKESIQ